MKWGLGSMVMYLFILIVAFFISLYYYFQLIHDSNIQSIFY